MKRIYNLLVVEDNSDDGISVIIVDARDAANISMRKESRKRFKEISKEEKDTLIKQYGSISKLLSHCIHTTSDINVVTEAIHLDHSFKAASFDNSDYDDNF